MIHRAIVKLSGETLAGGNGHGIDFDLLDKVCGVLAKAAAQGVQIGVVVGAGNFWRGAKQGAGRMDRARADHMGMLATTMNAIAIGDSFDRLGAKVQVFSATPMPAYAESYSPDRVKRAMEAGYIAVMGGGTGNPFVSTDTGIVLRALELGADVALMAKNVDAVYNRDPNDPNPNLPKAVAYDKISYATMLGLGLKAIDLSAACMAKDNNLNIRLFPLKVPENIYEVLMGAEPGTLLYNGEDVIRQ